MTCCGGQGVGGCFCAPWPQVSPCDDVCHAITNHAPFTGLHACAKIHLSTLEVTLSVNRRMTGVVRWFDGSRGYGYIEADGQDVFVHYSAITGNGLKNLLQGDKVEVVVEDSYRGPQAVEVTRLH